MGALTKTFSRAFSQTVRTRGDEYARRGHVYLQQANDDLVTAIVSGSDDYQVRFNVYEYTVGASCTCPRFTGGSLCKHLWAVLVRADTEGLLNGAIESPHALIQEWDDEGDDWGDDGLYAAPPMGDGGADREEDSLELLRQAGILTTADQLPHAPQYQPPPRPTATPTPPWQILLDTVGRQGGPAGMESVPRIRLGFEVSVVRYREETTVELVVRHRERLKSGEWGRLRLNAPSDFHVSDLADPGDMELLVELAGQAALGASSYGYYGDPKLIGRSFNLTHEVNAKAVLPRLCATGRCLLKRGMNDADPVPMRWDDGRPWMVQLAIEPAGGDWRFGGCLSRDGERMDLADIRALLPSGVVIGADWAGCLDDRGLYAWLDRLFQGGSVPIPSDAVPQFVRALQKLPAPPAIDLPAEWGIAQVAGRPEPILILDTGSSSTYFCDVMFDYDGQRVKAGASCGYVVVGEPPRQILRDPELEQRHYELARECPGLEAILPPDPRRPFELESGLVPELVNPLAERGWVVLIENKLQRPNTGVHARVSSGIDWFELDATFTYGDMTAALPDVLNALREHRHYVVLADGSHGLLPAAWSRRLGMLEALAGTGGDESMRFLPAQALLVDGLLDTASELEVDRAFDEARQRVRSFAGIQPVDPASSFTGQLRPYQRDGLAWLHFLREFGLGGCLADDMGLGKTVQVLAFLDRVYSAADAPERPALIVVPKSLLFNWQAEAARFAPRLKLLVHTGAGRRKSTQALTSAQLVLTSYGLLRQDIKELRKVEFEIAILDEAQAIKNADTATSRAARSLVCRQRLASSGTPVENHLGELWTLMEFLNPGMLGRASAFASWAGQTQLDVEGQRQLGQVLRPIILRRTKRQVATDLPERIEQTLYCELEGKQRKLYDELRDFYRMSLLEEVATKGMARTKIQVLEALLRLRQAACHPGLIDQEQRESLGAKLDVMMPAIEEVVAEGHKVLVFSQFVQFLQIVRAQLVSRRIDHAYLDGQTVDRQAEVDRFQSDPACPVFLISLKAGGLGLNLTAAEYVYLLDPWWNPAVENQAIDRAHRIGQTRQVVACRLIARDSVEEKVLALQETKRELADAILEGRQSVLRSLSVEDLEQLLS